VLPTEKEAPSAVTALRSFSPKDISDIAATGGGGGGSTNAFGTITVAGQSNVVADAAPDILTVVAGSNITLTTNAATDTITIAAAVGGSTNAFGSITVSGQSDVVADAAPDTLTLAGSNGVAITTNAATDTVTIAPTYGASANTVCQGNDARLSDARTPSAHATSHKSGGSDAVKLDELAAPTDVTTLNASTTAHGLLKKLDNNASHYMDGTGNWSTPTGGSATQAFGTITVSGQSDVVADAAPDTLTLVGSNGVAITTNAATDTVTFAPSYGASANTVCQGNDSRLADTRTPVAHAISHKSGGADAIKLDELAAPTDVTTLNATTSAHGLMPKGDGNAVHFYSGALTQVSPPYDILCGIVGKPSNSEVVLLFAAPRAFRIPANASGSQLKAGTAATGSSVFSIAKNGTQFLTATVAAAGTTATFASSQTDFAAGDVLKIVAPATADATLADIALTLAATLL
jgi:hypothetical protein